MNEFETALASWAASLDNLDSLRAKGVLTPEQIVALEASKLAFVETLDVCNPGIKAQHEQEHYVPPHTKGMAILGTLGVTASAFGSAIFLILGLILLCLGAYACYAT